MKFAKATKKITAIAASAALATSAAMAASNYPANFENSGVTVVVGSSAAASDMTAAESIISDIEAANAGESNNVVITYRSSSVGGETPRIMRSNSQINFGEQISASLLSSSLDDTDLNLFVQREYNRVNYDQTFSLSNVGGELTKKLGTGLISSQRTDDQVTGIFFARSEVLGLYELEFEGNGVIPRTSDKLSIMGQEYIISEIRNNEITLLGGSDSVTVGEGESTSITVNGNTYNVEVLSVSAASGGDRVLVSINGETRTIDEGRSVRVAGVDVIATELVPSSRDSVKGYAELVIGGQEIKLTGTGATFREVEVGGSRLSTSTDLTRVMSNVQITADGDDFRLEKFSLRWEANDAIVLKEGEMLSEPLFGVVAWSFDELVSSSKDNIVIDSSARTVSMDGVLRNGQDFVWNDMVEFDTDTSDLLLGTFIGRDRDVKTLFTGANGLGGTLDLTDTDNFGTRFLVFTESEETKLYELVDYRFDDVDEITENADEVTIRDVFAGTEFTVRLDRLADRLDVRDAFVEVEDGAILGTAHARFDLAVLADINALESGLSNQIELSNGLYMVLSDTPNSGTLTFNYDSDEITFDDANADIPNEEIEVTFTYDGDDVVVSFTPGSAYEGSEIRRSSDLREYVSRYGTTISYDDDRRDSITIGVPSSQTHAKVSLMFGGAAASTMTKTVASSAVESEKAKLESDGYTIVSTNAATSTPVSVDVTGPVMDSDVGSTENLIVVGGPAVNMVARELMGLSSYNYETDAGVAPGQGIARYFADENTVLVYGYSAADTVAVVERLNAGTVNFQ